jgi:DMSO/TMAO reductase YedYZ molybdopterin-dependent catalytic subunit
MSRRGFLGAVGLGAAALFFSIVGEVTGGPLRDVALLAPRGRSAGTGPNDFAVNETAAKLGIDRRALSPRRYRLELRGRHRNKLRLDDLRRLPAHTHELSISCVEGWSTTQTWTGVRLADLARLAGMPDAKEVFVESVQRGGAFASATLNGPQLHDERTLLALRVNGAALSIDHGSPARVIVPAAPGVHNTKWVNRLTFMA